MGDGLIITAMRIFDYMRSNGATAMIWVCTRFHRET